MELKDFPLFSKDILILTTDEDINSLSVGQAVSLQTYQDAWLLCQDDVQVVVHCELADQELLSRLILRDQTRWLLTSTRKGQLLLQYAMPVEVSSLAFELGVDELLAEDLYDKHETKDNTIASACQWFAEVFLVKGMDEGDWLAVARFANTASKGGFRLLGKGWRADVELGLDGRRLIKRVTRHNRQDSAFSLLLGQFDFVDASVAAIIQSASQQALLEAALRDNGSYLELWKLYDEKEWQTAQKKAEDLRTLRFVACIGFEDGRDNAWRLTPKSEEHYREFRERWRELDLPSDTQVDLGVQRPDWAEELAEADPKKSSSTDIPRGTIRFEDENCCVVFKPASNKRDVRPKMTEGWLYFSLAGYRTIGQRRLAARNSIDSGRRLAQLKWLLEGVGVPAARRRTIAGLTPYARETFKGGKPTDRQQLALETAMNTPDLAIIIGPPGTGKTQVIAALQRRLAEEEEDQQAAARILVCSFQHDAVDNALERSEVYGIPPKRVGGRRGAVASEAQLDPWLDQHATHLQDKIEAEYLKYPELAQIKALSHRLALIRVNGASLAGQAKEFSDILHSLRELEQCGLPLSPRLENRLENYIEQLQQQVSSKAHRTDPLVMRRIRALRVHAVTFADDGADRARDLYHWLQRHAPHSDPKLMSCLQDAARSKVLSEPILQELTMWQVSLLEQNLPDYRPLALKQKTDPAAKALLDEIDAHLALKFRQRKQGAAWVLEQLQDSLQMDRTAAQAVVNEYAMVVGATCQQSASTQMAALKSVVGLGSTAIEFDTVVVDEAARANPLDLFIPMAMAQRRIILVGDDRQLPHMLEPDLEGKLQEEHQLTEQQLEAFRMSLFERLRIKLQALEKLDSIRRVVMLDTQFRMHPILGDFISQQFYESVKLGKIEPGRKAHEFAFDPDFLSALGDSEAPYYRDKVCQWITVSAEEGKNQYRGKSRIREAEAQRIAEEVQRLMQAGGDRLSVGVITFYAAQRDLIMEKLSQTKIDGVPLLEKRNGTFEPHDHFKWAKKVRGDGSIHQEERLRVGSVDAFQGKEFDVVLLSCVRTYQPAQRTSKTYPDPLSLEHQLNKQFGFLRLPNRMNVAMSRQRQMLICVGDAALATCPEAVGAIPALAALHHLCGGAHGSIR